MSEFLFPILVDLVAILAIVGLYFRRHQRRDLLLAYIALNIGVFAVASVLANAPVSAGLGLGLFGILSIIRLRSDPITQEEVAYYFISLAMGLVAGLRPTPSWIIPAVAASFIVLLLVADHPSLFQQRRRQLVTLDVAVTDELELRARLEHRLGGLVKHMVVNRVDFVRDLTVVDVRFIAQRRLASPRMMPMATPRVQAPMPREMVGAQRR